MQYAASEGYGPLRDLVVAGPPRRGTRWYSAECPLRQAYCASEAGSRYHTVTAHHPLRTRIRSWIGELVPRFRDDQFAVFRKPR